MTLSAHLLSMLAAAALPPAPLDGIRDDARLFSDKGRQALASEMRSFTEKTGLAIFVDASTFLPTGTNARARAKALRPVWTGARDGVVICIDRSSQDPPGIELSDAIWNRDSEPEVLAMLDNNLRFFSSRKLDEALTIEGVKMLMQRLTTLEDLARQRTRLWRPSDTLLAGAFAAILLVGMLLTVVLSRLLRRSESDSAAEYWFPDVNVGQRFGAPFGGGVIVELTYHRDL